MHEVHIPPNLAWLPALVSAAPQSFLRGWRLRLGAWWAFDERWKCVSVTQFSQRCSVDGAEHHHALRRSPSIIPALSFSLFAFCWLIIECFVFVCAHSGKTIKRGSRSCNDEGSDAERKLKKQPVLVLRLRAVRNCLISPIEMMERVFMCGFWGFYFKDKHPEVWRTVCCTQS